MSTVEDYRRFFADEIRYVADLGSSALVDAFAKVPREKFIGPGPWRVGSPERRGLAAAGFGKSSYVDVDDPRQLYHNVVVVLDEGGDINNGQPTALAAWINALELVQGARVYHLGCGVGYYTAIIAEVVGQTGSVIGTEVNGDLAERARANLAGYPNVEVVAADGAAFDPGECDAMLINAGCTHPSPQWLDRLKPGGRLVLPITMATSATLGAGLMIKITLAENGWPIVGVSPVGIYSCTSMRDPELEAVLQKAVTTQAIFKLKSLRRDAHEQEESCVVHRANVCLSTLTL